MQEMIDKKMQEGVYAKTEDNTLQDLKRFQDFLYRNFSKYEKYNDMLPSSNQPAQLYGTTKVDKFDDINEITTDSLRFRPIIAPTGTYMYKTAQVISEYLKPLYENSDFIIKNTQDFAQRYVNSLLLKKTRNMYLMMSSRYFRTFPFMTP